jgi:RNA polymerase sigma-32 factor
LEALGVELGVSKERVRQLEKRALGKLRERFQKSFANPEELLN